MKRFYKTVSVSPAREVLLDGRSVRTPMRFPLILPNASLAEAVSGEWAAQGEEIDPRAMPFTGLANAAIDRVSPDPRGFAEGLAAYAENELLCYRAGEPPELQARQEAVWNPILDWARDRYDVSFTLVDGVMHRPQPAATLARLGEAVAVRETFQLAALSPLVSISGSLVIPLALGESVLEADAAFDAAHLDELWQAELWGEDALAIKAREVRRADFRAAARFLSLAGA